MPKPAKRQHFLARFYLRNFAEPMFGKHLQVFQRDKGEWERDPLTANGVGWRPHLMTMVDVQGKRTDAFDQFLKRQVEDPAGPAIKKLGRGEDLTDRERSAAATFIGLTAARNPDLMETVSGAQESARTAEEDEQLLYLAAIWSRAMGLDESSASVKDFLKPGTFAGLWDWILSFRRRVLGWPWRVLTTTRDRPYITTDWPVFAQKDRQCDVGFVSFPVSSEVALIIHSPNASFDSLPPGDAVASMNRGTMERATRFVVACKREFPGHEFLEKWLARETA